MYIYQQKDWPEFSFDQAKISPLLAEVARLQGRLFGRTEALGFASAEEAVLQILTQDVVKTSEIENEPLNSDLVRSSIARRLGIDIGGLKPVDRNVEAIVEVVLDATSNYDAALTGERLFAWHAALFPAGRSGMQKITVGKWRDLQSGEMQVVSGPYGREKIHYQAPSYEHIDEEMNHFIKWFNHNNAIDPVIKAAIAHFWFVTIHPFDDGNGRIARVISDMSLSICEKTPQRFYSMSLQIQKERKQYYEILEKCQKGNLDITDWIEWFLHCMKRAIIASDEILANIMQKAKFWRINAEESFNNRQKIIINLLLEGFEGKLTSSKWAKITKSSQDTALRDINDLLNRQILVKSDAGGRSTDYQLK